MEQILIYKIQEWMEANNENMSLMANKIMTLEIEVKNLTEVLVECDLIEVRDSYEIPQGQVSLS